MQFYRNEKWKELIHEDYDSKREEVFISNYGRVKKRKVNQKEFQLAKQTIVNNFFTFRFPSKTKLNRYNKKTTRSLYMHKIVAELFLEKEEEAKKFVIHKNHDLQNNHIDNLEFVNQKELTKHQQENPKRIEADKNKRRNYKLTETKVKLIKRKINDPNRRTRMRLIAKQFGVSTMQLYRIKSGENWGYIKENE